MTTSQILRLIRLAARLYRQLRKGRSRPRGR
jgi:hypothetical protein